MTQRAATSLEPTAVTMRQLGPCRRVVVKLGSALLARGGARYFTKIAKQIAQERQGGRDVVLVSSGAIALGLQVLGYPARPKSLGALQAAAAAGQPELMRLWAKAFGKHGIKVAQVLLTHADLASRERFLNARHALAELLRCGVVPVINENDSVATDEIRVGDNDNLSAHVAALLEADLLILLTTAQGVLDANPDTNPKAVRIATVSTPKDVLSVAGSASTHGLGTGGMRTKVEAAQVAVSRKIQVVIAHGQTSAAINKVLAGDDIGTLFLAPTTLASRKHWIAYTLKPSGTLRIDDGAAQAIAKQGRSLLPSGLTHVEGDFRRGAMVEIVGPEGLLARGLSAYGADELRRVQGKKSAEIFGVLGYVDTPEIVSRDDLVLLPLAPKT